MSTCSNWLRELKIIDPHAIPGLQWWCDFMNYFTNFGGLIIYTGNYTFQSANNSLISVPSYLIELELIQ